MLKNVSFEVKPGEMLGIVGKSGAGKSTLVNLISRLYDPDEGEVRLDGIDVQDLAFSSLRGAVAMVSQETYIFMGTVSENIAYARPDATREEIVRAAVAASAHGFICRRLPHGYDTVIGSGGRELSGGERQRLSIARAILADPQILVLDEATASVDTETERAIQDSLDSSSRAGPPSLSPTASPTLRSADHLIVLDNGEAGGKRQHAELVEKGVCTTNCCNCRPRPSPCGGSNRDGSRIWSIFEDAGLSSGIWSRGCPDDRSGRNGPGDAVSVKSTICGCGIRPKTAVARWWRYIMGRWRAISMCTGKRDRTLCRYGHPGDRGFRRAGKITCKNGIGTRWTWRQLARAPGRLPGRRPAQRVRRHSGYMPNGVSSGRFGGVVPGRRLRAFTPFAAMTTI